MLLSVVSQAVRLESAYHQRTRYMVIVSTNGRQDTEENVVLGMDFSDSDRSVLKMLLYNFCFVDRIHFKVVLIT